MHNFLFGIVASNLLIVPHIVVNGNTARPIIQSRTSARHLAFSASTSSSTIAAAKQRVLSVAERCRSNSSSGVFLTNESDRRDLKKSVAELEAVCGLPTSEYRDLMIGDWELLTTTNSNSGGITMQENDNEDEDKDSGNPLLFGLSIARKIRQKKNPLEDFARQNLNVSQRIRTMGDDGKEIDRIDNVVEFLPIDTEKANSAAEPLRTLLKAIDSLPLNPLQISGAKISLVHEASVQSITPVLRTRIGLQSIVATVAGDSQYLDPDGADIFGVNTGIGSMFNGGSFDTTYVDEDIRVSRGSIGFLDELRVFIRKGSGEQKEDAGFIDEPEVIGSFFSQDVEVPDIITSEVDSDGEMEVIVSSNDVEVADTTESKVKSDDATEGVESSKKGRGYRYGKY
mmetsp:Transcript_24929/g.30635  ORF Transcript_24929/g.30635 Transcript_24929/m.30635 type:complete len:398 (+) Transcript_24929:118-1311(+)